MSNIILNIDAMKGMKRLADKSVDMIFVDLPYQKTHNSWDVMVASLRELLKNVKTSYDKALKNIKERDEKIAQLKEINDIAEQNKEASKKSFKSKIGRIFSLS